MFIVSLSDPFIAVMNCTRSRCTVSSKGTLLNTIRANTVTFGNSFYCRAPRIWNTLPAHLWNTNTYCSVAHFKKDLFNYYLYLTKSVYDVNTPQAFKSVCIKCHTSRPLNSLLDHYVLLIFYRCPPQFCFCISISFFVISKIFSFLLVV